MNFDGGSLLLLEISTGLSLIGLVAVAFLYRRVRKNKP